MQRWKPRKEVIWIYTYWGLLFIKNEYDYNFSNNCLWFSILTVPSEPLDLKIINYRPVTIKWEKPKIIPGIIIKYEVTLTWIPKYCLPDFCDQERYLQIPLEDNRTEIVINSNKINGHSDYLVYVRAATSKSWGNPTKFIKFISLPGSELTLVYFIFH